MNKRSVFIFIILLLFSIVLMSCANQNAANTDGKETAQSGSSSSNQTGTDDKKDTSSVNTNESRDKLTIEDIKAEYTGGDAGQLVNMTSFKNQYILVEFSLEGISGHGFEFYDLKTGDKDALPLNGLQAKLDEIVNENHIRFICDGTNNVNSHRYFPEILECSRGQEIKGYEGDFYPEMHSYYLPIDQGYEMGIKPNETIADIKVSIKGIEVIFEPMKGEEGGFYAAYTTVPPTKTSYDKTKNQFIIEFQDTDIDSKLDLSKVSQQNRYMNSVGIKRNGSNTTLTINLKDTPNYYNIKFSHAEPKVDDFPCLDFNFASEYGIDEIDSITKG